MKVLYTTPMLEYPATSGPHLRIENSIKALSQICELHLISRVPQFLLGSPDAKAHYQALASQFHFSPKVRGLSSHKWRRRAQKLTTKLLVNDAKYLVDYARSHQINVIWFGYGNLSDSVMRAVRTLAPELKLICDTDSVWSRFVYRESQCMKDPVQISKLKKEAVLWQRREQDWLQMCDITTAVSEVDAAYYASIGTKDKVAVFSNVIDLQQYQQEVSKPLDLKQPSIYLAGSFGKPTSAMNIAANWMLDEVLPILRQSIPDIHFYIVGRYSDVAFSHLKDNRQITVTGMLESVMPYLKHVSCALTPLKYESGTRFKILESGAAKTPMVSTTLGAEGLPVTHNQHLLIADTPRDFAQSIVRIIQDGNLRRDLSENCFNLVKERYSIDSLAKEGEMILNKVATC